MTDNVSQEQTDNSRPWLFKPGQSGNPGGRPIGSVSLVTRMRGHLADVIAPALADALELPPDATIADALVVTTARAALQGDPQARKLVWEYMDGPVRRTLAISTDSPTGYADWTIAEMFARIEHLRLKARHGTDTPTLGDAHDAALAPTDAR